MGDIQVVGESKRKAIDAEEGEAGAALIILQPLLSFTYYARLMTRSSGVYVIRLRRDCKHESQWKLPCRDYPGCF